MWGSAHAKGSRSTTASPSKDDRCKIVDVSVMGVWLAATYQTQFAQFLQRTGSLDGLCRRSRSAPAADAA